MRRSIASVVTACLVVAGALPALAAPNNSRNSEFIVNLDCGSHGEFTVRPQPGNGNPAWNTETGEVLVGRHFDIHVELTASITEGPTLSTTVDFEEDYGSNAPAHGMDPLVTCVSINSFTDGPFVIDEQLAAVLNAEFGTGAFMAGQEVTITGIEELTIKVMFPLR